MNRIKVYIDVLARFDGDGRIRPLALIWEDGQKYRIDRVSDVRSAASLRAGGQGDRYTIFVNGQQRYLYFERSAATTGREVGRWFVERRTAEGEEYTC